MLFPLVLDAFFYTFLFYFRALLKDYNDVKNHEKNDSIIHWTMAL